jgi:superfamily II DNA/RNA helicase
VDRFHADRACRAFLSTDAGGVGLNLQHAAATIVNMELPWNPAILEQRIGRVHRLGQSKSVQVVSFVAEGTIEEKMLSILAFKKSLFAGVLDGGASEIFLGGTRLTKFMERVDAVTRRDEKPEAAATRESEAPQSPSRASQETAVPVTSDATSDVKTQDAAMTIKENSEGDNPWAPLLSVGLKLLETLATPPHEAASNGVRNGHTGSRMDGSRPTHQRADRC